MMRHFVRTYLVAVLMSLLALAISYALSLSGMAFFLIGMSGLPWGLMAFRQLAHQASTEQRQTEDEQQGVATATRNAWDLVQTVQEMLSPEIRGMRQNLHQTRALVADAVVKMHQSFLG